MVSVLAGRAVPAEEIDEAVAEERIRTALAEPAHTPEKTAANQRGRRNCGAVARRPACGTIVVLPGRRPPLQAHPLQRVGKWMAAV